MREPSTRSAPFARIFMTNVTSRVLIYSHDSFGLGHLRRCRALAGALTRAHPHLSVLILSGSPIIGSFSFPPRVDFVRVPGVIKLQDGAYVPLSLEMGIEETIRLRARLIEEAALAFHPDIVIVDKEPLGLRGELAHALPRLKERGAHLVLGLRDVLDDIEALDAEWRRKRVGPALENLYDDIWIYGARGVFDPLDGLGLSQSVLSKVRFTGYLRREVPAHDLLPRAVPLPDQPYLLITTGGGGDGDGLIDWVLSAYEQHGHDLMHGVVVLGPFMEAARQAQFLARAQAHAKLTALVFDAEMERLISRAAGVVAMGGYNTFCEILSFDRKAVIVPRERPRREQWLRASRAQELKLVRMLEDPAERGGARHPDAMAAALIALPQQDTPSRHLDPALMGGLDYVADAAGALIAARAERRRAG
ncbi:MAG TPA: hypothetical protein PLA85_00840 [Micropepsaceae bacterium]|nr:hypothetical protein [Micropepsaceae bacterium]